MIDFIVNNYQLILLSLACLIEIFVFIFTALKKKTDISLSSIINQLPELISAAEKKYGSGNGQIKKDYVLRLASLLYKNMTGVELFGGSVLKTISKAVEVILETPQKKGK